MCKEGNLAIRAFDVQLNDYQPDVEGVTLTNR